MSGGQALCRVTIDLAALQENLLQLRAYAEEISPPVSCPGARRSRPLCVLKADAYGHGACACAAALSQVGGDFFAVATASEALALRRAVPSADILILSPILPEDAPLLAASGITATVGSEQDMRTYAAAVRRAIARGELPRTARLACHVKVDTGMHRLGFPAAHRQEGKCTAYALRSLCALPGIHLRGIYTHPAAADDPRDPLTGEQLAAFCRIRRLLGEGYFYHFSNSAASLSLGTLGFEGYRLGIALYGLPPGEHFPTALSPRLRAVARVETRLTRVFTLRRGERLGYGGDFRATRDTRVGVAAIGYADGLPRAATGATLLVRGKPARIIGRVCMDQCMLALGNTEAVVGEPVTVLEESGRQLQALARQAGSIPYELLCHLSRRAERIYLS